MLNRRPGKTAPAWVTAFDSLSAYRLTVAELAVAKRLITWADPNGESWRTVDTLASAEKLDVRRVRRALASLEQKGVIVRTYVRQGSRLPRTSHVVRRLTVVFRVNVPPWGKGHPVTTARAVLTGGVTPAMAVDAYPGMSISDRSSSSDLPNDRSPSPPPSSSSTVGGESSFAGEGGAPLRGAGLSSASSAAKASAAPALRAVTPRASRGAPRELAGDEPETNRAPKGARPSGTRDVWTFWRQTFQLLPEPTPAERRRGLDVIAERRREGYSVGELVEAIEGARRSPFNRDNAARQSVPAILGSRDRVEGCRRHAPVRRRGGGQEGGISSRTTPGLNRPANPGQTVSQSLSSDSEHRFTPDPDAWRELEEGLARGAPRPRHERSERTTTKGGGRHGAA